MGAVKQGNENCSQMFIPLVNLKNFEHLALAANKSLLFHPALPFFFWGRKRGNFYVRPAGGCSTLSCGQPSSAKLANPAQQLSSNFQL